MNKVEKRDCKEETRIKRKTSTKALNFCNAMNYKGATHEFNQQEVFFFLSQSQYNGMLSQQLSYMGKNMKICF